MKILVLLLSLLLSSACSTKPYIVKETDGNSASGDKKIYVLNHGWHTSLVIPAKDIMGDLPELKNRFGNTPYIEFGWGDRGFYQAEKITTDITLRALFWPSAAVIHAVAVPSSPYDYFPNSEVLEVCLTNQGYTSLQKFVTNSSRRVYKRSAIHQRWMTANALSTLRLLTPYPPYACFYMPDPALSAGRREDERLKKESFKQSW